MILKMLWALILQPDRPRHGACKKKQAPRRELVSVEPARPWQGTARRSLASTLSRLMALRAALPASLIRGVCPKVKTNPACLARLRFSNYPARRCRVVSKRVAPLFAEPFTPTLPNTTAPDTPATSVAQCATGSALTHNATASASASGAGKCRTCKAAAIVRAWNTKSLGDGVSGSTGARYGRSHRRRPSSLILKEF